MNTRTGNKLKGCALLLLGIAMFGGIIAYSDIKNWDRLLNVRILPALLTIPASAATTFLVARRWGFIANEFSKKKHLALIAFFRCQAIASFLSQIFPKEIADLGGRTYWLNKQVGQSLFSAGLAVFWDRFFDLALLLCALPASIVFFSVTYPDVLAALTSLAGTLLVGGFLLTFTHGLILKATINLTTRLTGFIARFTRLALHLPEATELPPLSRRTVAALFGLTAAKLATLTFFTLCTVNALQLNISPWVLFFGIPVSQAAFVFSFTAGGMGVLEAGWFAVLSIAGVPGEDIGLFLIAQRILDTLSQLAVAAMTQFLTGSSHHCD